MEDYGLLTGLAEGLKGGMQGYYDAQKRNRELEALKQDRELKKKQYLASLAAKGLKEAEGGGFVQDESSPYFQKGLLDQKYKEAQTGLVNEQASYLRGGKMSDAELAKEGMKRNPLTGLPEDDPSSPISKKRILDNRLREAQEKSLLAGVTGKEAETEKTKTQTGLLGEQQKAALRDKGYMFDDQGHLIDDVNTLAYKERQAKLGQTTAQTGLITANTGLVGAKTKSALAPKKPGAVSLPKDQQIQANELSRAKAKVFPIRSQMDSLLVQLNDPNIDSGQKLQAAQNAAKLINSPLGADAVGADEAKRVLGYLQYGPNMIKGLKLGPDIEGFAKALSLQSSRLKQSENDIQDKIDSIYGRSPKGSGGLIGGGSGAGTMTRQQKIEAAKKLLGTK